MDRWWKSKSTPGSAAKRQMRFSVRFNNDLPVGAYAPLARAAEQAGFDQFWVSDDLFLRSAWIT